MAQLALDAHALGDLLSYELTYYLVCLLRIQDWMLQTEGLLVCWLLQN